MWISHWFVLFVVYSVFGWIYETTYCTIKGKKWENRGFLYGPLCPIYGAGCVGITAIMQILSMNNIKYSWWMVFIIGYFGSIVLEYTTHWALEKIFNAYWWDYSYMPLNIKGRVCLPYSICFGVAAVLVTYIISPFVIKITSWISPVTYELFGLLFMLFLGMDIALTISALSDFENYVAAAEEALNKHMDQFVGGVEEKAGQMSDAMSAKFFNDEKEKFSKEKITSGIRLMGDFSRAAIMRVQGFRTKKSDRIGRNRILEVIKKYKPGNRNKEQEQ